MTEYNPQQGYEIMNGNCLDTNLPRGGGSATQVSTINGAIIGEMSCLVYLDYNITSGFIIHIYDQCRLSQMEPIKILTVKGTFWKFSVDAGDAPKNTVPHVTGLTLSGVCGIAAVVARYRAVLNSCCGTLGLKLRRMRS